MFLPRRVGFWLRALIFRKRVEREMDKEMRQHLEMEVEHNIRRGMPPAEARRAARIAFGSVDRAKEDVRDERGTRWLEQLASDVRFGARSLRRRPAFATVAIGTIALSIGAATSIFSVVDSVLFRSLPYREPGRLMAVWQTVPDWRTQPILASSWDHVVLDYLDFRNWRDHQTAFTAVGAWSDAGFMLAHEDRVELVSATRVSPSLFDALGVRALVGRAFLPGEDVLNGPRVVLLGYDAWQNRFGGRRDVVGTRVLLDSIPFQVVGVLPSDFALVRGQPPNEFFVPAGQEQSDVGRGNHSYRAIGRLKPRSSVEQAATEASNLLGGDSERPQMGIRILEYQIDQTRAVRGPLLLLLSAVGILVLIASLNIATLLLGEAATREHEIGARIALGASRGRLTRQFLTESMLLAALGAGCGILLAWWMTKALVAMAPTAVPGIQMARVDGRVLGVTAAVTVMTGVICGLAPAFVASGTGPATLLHAGFHVTRGRGRLQRIIIVSQVSLSVVLLVGAGLVSRSLTKLGAVDPGFKADHLLSVRAALPSSAFKSVEGVRVRYAELIDRIGAVPGVVAVTAGSAIPFDGIYSTSRLKLESDIARGDAAPKREAQQRVILPNYFSVLGVPMLMGRAFNDNDRAAGTPVVIVSEALARRDWPTESPMGKRVMFQSQWRTVVGVVADIKTSTLAEHMQATIYSPFAQRPVGLTFAFRTHDDPSAVLPAIRALFGEITPDMPITAASIVTDRIRESFAEQRFRTTLIDLFGVMAIVLAAVGTYGVTVRAVSRRMREVGIRLALGATRYAIVRMIMDATLGGVSIGVAIGLAASTVASKLLAPYLFGVSTHDPATFAGILILLMAITSVASWLPASRAGQVAPASVLRGE